MPLIKESHYEPPFWLKNGHANTVYSNLFRSLPKPLYKRALIRTLEDDIVVVDKLTRGHSKLVVLCHGLEGSSDSAYMKSMTTLLSKAGYDVICLNFRGCGGIENRSLQMYHSGDTSDLHMILKYFQYSYETIDLVGFSLGGNVILKYLGENVEKVHHKVRRAVAVSVPVDLEGSSYRLAQWDNYLYTQMFLKSLIAKVKSKSQNFPNQIDLSKLKETRNLYDFDNYYTAPIHGFEDAEDYYMKSSSRQYLKQIRHDTMLINAMDDPFLSQSCFPIEEARASDNFHLMMTNYGGHIGFSVPGNWSFHEKVILSFLSDKNEGNPDFRSL
jgi:predicted alpha/beta-fold hydrolase